MIALMLALALILTGVDVTAAQTANRGTTTNPQEVRPGDRDGDRPSATVGQLKSTSERRILGLPVTAAIVIGGLVIVLLLVAGAVVPRSRRNTRARGGGTYGGRDGVR